MDIEKYLPYMELAVVGGESDHDARPLDFQWVLDVREQCRRQGARFNFRQCGTHFIKDGQTYTHSRAPVLRAGAESGDRSVNGFRGKANLFQKN